jgi:hypothetical protein
MQFRALPTRTSMDQPGSGKHWKVLETQELELGYIADQEHYRLLKVNGKTTDLENRVKKGYFTPGGEFGSSLADDLHPEGRGGIRVGSRGVVRGRAIVRIPLPRPGETSALAFTADADHVNMAHHGLASADCDTGMVTRIRTETEPA